MKIRNSDSNQGKSESVITSKRAGFFLGSPYSSDSISKCSVGNKPRKYPSNRGWITIQECSEITGLSINKIYRILKHKDMDYVLDNN